MNDDVSHVSWRKQMFSAGDSRLNDNSFACSLRRPGLWKTGAPRSHRRCTQGYGLKTSFSCCFCFIMLLSMISDAGLLCSMDIRRIISFFHQLWHHPQTMAALPATMKGLYLPGDYRVEFREVPRPSPSHGQQHPSLAKKDKKKLSMLTEMANRIAESTSKIYSRW